MNSIFIEAVSNINAIKYKNDIRFKILKSIKYLNIIRKANKNSIKVINSIDTIDTTLIQDFIQFITSAKIVDLFSIEEINLDNINISMNETNGLCIEYTDNNNPTIDDFRLEKLSIYITADSIKLTLESSSDTYASNDYSIEREKININYIDETNKTNEKIISLFVVNFAYILSESIKIVYKNMRRMYL